MKNIVLTSNSQIHEQGFTLIEMMIVVAIIGVLAAIAIPQYQLFISKAQSGRIVAEVSELRLSAEDCINEGKMQIGLGENQCDPRAIGSNLIKGSSQVGVVLPNNTGVAQFTNPLTVTTTIKATIAHNVAPPLVNKLIVWQRDADGAWLCKSNIEVRYLPVACSYDSSL